MTDRLFLARDDRQRLTQLSQAWKMRGSSDAVTHNNSLALDSAIQAADEAEMSARRIRRAELVMEDLFRELARAARRGSASRRQILKFAEQLDDVHDIMIGHTK